MKHILKSACIFGLLLLSSSCAEFNKRPQEVKYEIYEDTETGSQLKVENYDFAKNRSPDGIRVGLVLPLTGEHTKIGRQMLDSSQLAMYELKVDNINLVPIDSSLNQTDFDTKISSEKVDIVLGPMFGDEALKYYEVADKKNICMISYSNDSDLSGKRCLFLIGVMPDESVTKVIDYAFKKNYEMVHVVLPNSKYGVMVEDAIANMPHKLQSKIRIIGRYNDKNMEADLDQVAANIAKFSSPKSTALLIPEGKKVLKVLKPKLNQRGGKISSYKLLGSGMWESQALIDDPDVDGAWFAVPPIGIRERFDIRFANQFGYIPSRLTTLAYDSVALMKVLSTDYHSYGAVKKEELLNPHGFKGMTGLFKFKQNGLNERSLAVYEIKDGKIEEIEPASKTL